MLAPILRLALPCCGGDLGRALRRIVEIALAGRQRLHLRRAGALEEVDLQERLADRPADRERAVVAEDHRALVAEIGDDPLALVEIDRDALIIVIGDLVADQHRGLGQRQQPLGMGGDRLAVGRVEVDHRLRVLARHVQRRMDGEAGGVGDERRRLDRMAVHVRP